MKRDFASPEDYLDQLPEDRKEAMIKLRNTVLVNLPEGFSEVIQYGMISYVVPLSIYPEGYLGDPRTPLPFISIASQKDYISFYHMGLYAKQDLLEWFTREYSKLGSKLDMGKSCVRFKKVEKIPYELLGGLSRKITPSEWIWMYESGRKSDQKMGYNAEEEVCQWNLAVSR